MSATSGPEYTCSGGTTASHNTPWTGSLHTCSTWRQQVKPQMTTHVRPQHPEQRHRDAAAAIGSGRRLTADTDELVDFRGGRGPEGGTHIPVDGADLPHLPHAVQVGWEVEVRRQDAGVLRPQRHSEALHLQLGHVGVWQKHCRRQCSSLVVAPYRACGRQVTLILWPDCPLPACSAGDCRSPAATYA